MLTINKTETILFVDNIGKTHYPYLKEKVGGITFKNFYNIAFIQDDLLVLTKEISLW